MTAAAKVVLLHPEATKPPEKKNRELTDAFLRTVRPPAKGRIELRDKRVPGLVLRITSTGVATWSVRTRTKNGKQTRPALGTWPHTGIAEARKAAMAAIAAIQAGGDLIAEKQQARAERKAKAAERTVVERLKEWREAKEADTAKPWSSRYASEVSRIAKRDIEPKLGKRLLAETTRADWAGLVAAKRKAAPAMAASLFRTVSSFLGHAEAHGWIAAPLLPRKGAATLAPAPAPRERSLTDAELVEVWQAAGSEPPKLRAFVRLLVLDAARELEAADIAVGEIDWSAGRWTIPGTRTKNKEPITLPLCPLALAELRAAMPNEDVGAEYRLLGRIRGSGFRGFSKLKSRLDGRIAAARRQAADEAGTKMVPMPRWRWHDLRRTARTGMTKLGVPREHAEAALNHLSARSTLERTYDRYDYGPEIVAALSKWQAHVSDLVKEAGRAR